MGSLPRALVAHHAIVFGELEIDVTSTIVLFILRATDERQYRTYLTVIVATRISRCGPAAITEMCSS